MTGPATPPARPQRERDRYARASVREQVTDALSGLRRQPGVVAVLVAVLGGWLFFLVTRPPVVSVDGLAAGDCLYIHAGDADTDSATGRPAGSAPAQLQALYLAGAERASCGGSHSHEVVLQLRFPEASGAAYPGAAALDARNAEACRTAFETYIGGPEDASPYQLLVAVPDEAAWGRGVRAAPCLLGTRDGSWLLRPARAGG